MVRLVLCAAVCLITAVAVESKSPGLQTRITTRALNYATDVALDILTKKIDHQKIPDQNGKSGKVEFHITGMTINKFTKPSSTISMTPNVGLKWETSGTGLGLHGDFKYTIREIIKISDHGSFDLSASGIGFSIQIAIGADPNGRPTIKSAGCDCRVGSVDVKFHGGASWLYNIFSGFIKDKIKSMVGGNNGIICKQVVKLIDEGGEQYMKQLPVAVPIAKMFLLDYRFLTKPSFQSSFMETYHKGEVYWSSNPIEAPFGAPPLLQSSSTSKMMYIWVSDFVFNSMSYNAFKYQKLQYNVTDKDIPGGILNTTCSTTCIGKFIPVIGQKFPNSKVMLDLRSTAMPNMTATGGVTVVNAEGDIRFFAQKAGGKDTYFLTLAAKMSTTINITLQNAKVYAKVEKLPITVKVRDTKIGQLSDTMLNFLINSVVTVFVEPKLNDLGKNGFPLPMIDSVHFVNTDLKVHQDTLLISTDLKYSG